jgi:hypothetical protein
MASGRRVGGWAVARARGELLEEGEAVECIEEKVYRGKAW